MNSHIAVTPVPTGLAAFSIELLAHIFDFVAPEEEVEGEGSLKWIRTLAAVNKSFQSASRLFAHTKKQISTCGSNFDNLSTVLKEWLGNDEILRRLRHLTITSHQGSSPSPPSKQSPLDSSEQSGLSTLVTLIQNLGNLKTLTWWHEDPIPMEVICALEQHQTSARLYVPGWHRADETTDHNDPQEIMLSQSPALRSVSASLWNLGRGSFPDLREAAFHRMVACAPNLRSVRVSQGHWGCVFRTISVDGRIRLREMSDKFRVYEKPNSSIRSLRLDGFSLRNETFATWSQIVDFTSLQNFELFTTWYHGDESFGEILSNLTSLEHLSLLVPNCPANETGKSLWTCITNGPPLQSLKLWSWPQAPSLEAILRKHGPTLRLLHLHDEGTHIHPDIHILHRILSVEEIKTIQQQCPNLQELGLDVNRQQEDLELDVQEHAEVFTAVSRLNLHRLNLYIDFRMATRCPSRSHNDQIEGKKPIGPFKIPKPSEIETYLRHIWEIVFAESTLETRTLTIHFGEEQGLQGGWRYSQCRSKGRWEARAEERDDRRRFCKVRKIQ